MPVVVDDCGAISNPGTQAGKITIPFLQSIDRIDNLPVHEAENSCIQRNRVICERSQHAVKEGKEHCQRLAAFLPASADGSYDLRPTAPGFHELGDDIG